MQKKTTTAPAQHNLQKLIKAVLKAKANEINSVKEEIKIVHKCTVQRTRKKTAVSLCRWKRTYE
jgi:hypothetical protein